MIGQVAALFRYPVKSMGGEPLETAGLGWHGLEGDRRLALRRCDDRSGFPWLTASRLPELLQYLPQRRDPGIEGDLPTHVRTPDGADLGIFSPELASEIGRRHRAPVEMQHQDRGIFDDAAVSLITVATVDEVGTLAALHPDVRRFRPNILLASLRAIPFEEDEWVGRALCFGEEPDGAVVTITHRDERCAMVNLDPDSARPSPEILRAIVRARDNKAGVYGTVTRGGRLAVGQPVFLASAT